MYSTAVLHITQEQRLRAGASVYLTEAAEILNPGQILSTLIDEAKMASRSVDSKMTDELEIVST
jgi:hypothetical protein